MDHPPDNITVVCDKCHKDYVTSEDMEKFECPHCTRRSIAEHVYELMMDKSEKNAAEVIGFLMYRLDKKGEPFTYANVDDELLLWKKEVKIGNRRSNILKTLGSVARVVWMIFLVFMIADIVRDWIW